MPHIIDFKIFKEKKQPDLQILSTGKLAMVVDTQSVIQKIYITLSTNLGDFFYNIEQGVDWSNIYNKSQAEIAPILIETLSDIKGVDAIQKANITYDEHRKALIDILMEDIFGKTIYIGG